MSEEQTNGLDALLERALASYAKADPPPNLAQRVLIQIAHAPRRRSVSWRIPVWASLAAVSMTALLILYLPVESRKPSAIHQAQVHQARQVLELPVPPKPAVARAVPISLRKPPHQRALLPTRSQFPTPTPLSKEELALRRIVQEKNFAPDWLALDQPIEPIRIAAIQIKSLKEFENE